MKICGDIISLGGGGGCVVFSFAAFVTWLYEVPFLSAANVCFYKLTAGIGLQWVNYFASNCVSVLFKA